MNGDRPPEWPVRPDPAPDRPEPRRTAQAPRRSETETVRARGTSPNWTTIGLIAGLLLLVALVAYFATSRNPDQDKLTGGEAGAGAASADDPAKLCASKSTYDFIKRQIFRQAAQVRGSDQATYDRLASYASLRMENPVMESEDSSNNAVNCSGSLAIDLPPGLAVAGGRRTLTADVDYTVQPAADGSGNVVVVRNADAIVTPLATLTRVGQPAPAAGETPPTLDDAAPAEPGAAPQPQPQPQQQTAPAPAPAPAPQPPRPEPAENRPTASARPSFNCANARTKGEIAVCSDSGLASLDRNMAAQYGRAMSGASPEQRALLRRTRDRFLSYRDRCPNRSCMGDAYVGRMREIRDIMEGRWQPR